MNADKQILKILDISFILYDNLCHLWIIIPDYLYQEWVNLLLIYLKTTKKNKNFSKNTFKTFQDGVY